MNLTSMSANGMYKALAGKLITEGKVVKARGMLTKELSPFTFEILKPWDRLIFQPTRAIDMHYCIGELCYFLDQRTDLASIVHYSKFWNHISDDGKTVNSAYGNRLFKNPDQLEYVANVLISDPGSRKAVMTIYERTDSKESNDNPCTMFLQFVIRDNKLNCFVNMRSNDFWLGVPYDVFFFTLLHELLWVKLAMAMPTLRLGKYYHSATSMHVYEQHFDKLEAVSKEKGLRPATMPGLSYQDVRHWFNDLLTYEKAHRGVVLYKQEDFTTRFQDWCKQFLTNC